MRGMRPQARGVSLIEAMVALAVMAFGTLGVLGVQATLRLNADIAKQRSEAVRIAQEALETARSFQALDDYTALTDATDDPVAGYATANTTYLVTRTVTDAAAGDPAGPRRKGVVVDVRWTDRTGQLQSIRLASAIEGVAPALAGSLGVPARLSIGRNPGGRHPAIPMTAVDQGDGESLFEPPGSGLGWRFDNLTADITQVCTGVGLVSCTPINARLLAGFVRFATSAAPPAAADALLPTGAVQAVDVSVALTAPAATTVACFEETLDGATRAYYCAVPVADTGAWSGRSTVEGLAPADSVADATAGLQRVCRYTPYRGGHPIVPTGMSNPEHPLDYVLVAGPLVSQNFLVIQSGNGGVAYDCPGDVPDDLVNSNTWHHQPAS
jgi:type II secretory pathway pseudopilin PulG